MSDRIKRQNRQQGFTLMELLIVVAIIAVLVAIAIPMFRGALSKSKAAACAANRRSLKAQLMAQYMSGDRTLPENESEIDLGALKDQFVCPSDGEIKATVDPEGQVTVTCSVHTEQDDGGEPTIAEKQALLNRIFATLSSAYDDLGGIYNSTIDSAYRNDPERWAYQVYAKLSQSEKDMLDGYVWTIKPQTGGYRIFFVRQEDFDNAVNNGGTYEYYKYNPEDGQYQSSSGGTVRNDGKHNLINLTGKWGDWSETLPEKAF